MPAVALDTLHRIRTPEHSAFAWRLTGPVARLLAYGIDQVASWGVLIGVGILLAIFGGNLGIGLALIFWFFLSWLGGAVCEWLWSGKTPGKYCLGIRVVQDDGQTLGFSGALLRNLVRYVDMLPTPLTGLMAMLVNHKFQRLGDLAAGTIVIYDDKMYAPRSVTGLIENPMVVAMANDIPSEILSLIDGATARAIQAWVEMSVRFSQARRREMASPLVVALCQRLRIPVPVASDVFLLAVQRIISQAGEQQAGVGAARSATHIARRSADWQLLENMLPIAQQDKTHRRKEKIDAEGMSSEPQPARFARLLRSASADVALAEAYHLPQPVIHRLHQIVSFANLRFHQRADNTWQVVRRTLLIEAPAKICGDACVRVACATFFLSFMLCCLWAFAMPNEAVAWFGERSADQLREMYKDAPRDRQATEGVAATGFYINNNVGISLACFASGIVAGVGSLVWLLMNGIYLGCAFGIMLAGGQPASGHFLEFVSAHGPFELTGIALSGAAGLRFGLGIIQHRGLTIGASLLRSARESVPVLAVAATFVGLAAPIEAFVSPSDIPVLAKRAVMVFSIIIIVGYIAVLGKWAQYVLRQEAEGRLLAMRNQRTKGGEKTA